MVFAVQCPNPQCRKFMLIEEKDRDQVITCLICKSGFRIGQQPDQSTTQDKTKQPS